MPAGLRAIVGRGELGYERTTVAGDHFLVTGAPAGNGTKLYFFFPENGVRHELSVLRNVLLGGVGILVLLAALAGAVLARSALRPVARASTAAHSLAEGLLETRLPVEGRDEFGAWAQSFNEMAAALEAKIGELQAAQARERRFTADVAHELRTPLTALMGEASLLADQLDRMPPESRRPAELLIADVARLRRLVEDLMEISRFDAGAESVHAEEVDVPALVRATVRSRGWDDRVRLEGDGLRVTSDPRRLERIVANLLDNALEHGGSVVSVRIGERKIEVADDGQGIAPEDLPHVFERFYKADVSRSGGGTGLGLAIARENALLLGASWWSSASRARAAASRWCSLWQNRYATVTATLLAGGRMCGVCQWKPLKERDRRPAQERLVRRLTVFARAHRSRGAFALMLVAQRRPGRPQPRCVSASRAPAAGGPGGLRSRLSGTAGSS